MKGLFWNIRGLGQNGRVPALANKIRENHANFVGVVETKKRRVHSWNAKISNWEC